MLPSPEQERAALLVLWSIGVLAVIGGLSLLCAIALGLFKLIQWVLS